MRSLLLMISFALTASCTSTPPDIAACKPLDKLVFVDKNSGSTRTVPSPTCQKNIQEDECGYCVRIVSGNSFFVGEAKAHQFSGKPWSQLRSESIYLPAAESYSPLAAYILKVCAEDGCSTQLTKFKTKIDALKAFGDPKVGK